MIIHVMFDQSDIAKMIAGNPEFESAIKNALIAEVNRRTAEGGESPAALPATTIPADLLAAGIPAFRLFAESGMAVSNGEARRLIRGGGARINDVAVQDESLMVTSADLVDGAIKLSSGQNTHILVRLA